MKKATLLLAVLLAISLLSGCFPTGEISSIADDSEAEFLPGLNVTLNISYPQNPPEKMLIYSGSFMEWDIHDLGEFFIPGFENLCDEDIEEYTERENSRGAFFSYMLKDGQRLSTSPGMISYVRNGNDPRDFDINYSYYCAAGESVEEMNKVYPFKEFSDFSSQEALKCAQNAVNALGIENLTAPQIYSVESRINPFLETVNPEIITMFSDEQLHALTGNPAYYILYTVQLDGYKTPVTETYYSQNDMSGIHGFAEFLIDKDGIQHFFAAGLMDYLPTGEYVNICTPFEAVEKMKNSIGKANETVATEICGVELFYLGDYDNDSKTSKFIPVWRFVKARELGGKFPKSDFFFYDAQTLAMYSEAG